MPCRAGLATLLLTFEIEQSLSIEATALMHRALDTSHSAPR